MLAKVLIYMILFFLVASPSTFKFMRRMLGGWVASAEGVPRAPGLLLHSAVYVLLACYLPAKLVSGFEEEYEEEFRKHRNVNRHCKYGYTMNADGSDCMKT